MPTLTSLRPRALGFAVGLLVLASLPGHASAQTPSHPDTISAPRPPVIEIPGRVVADTLEVRRKELSLREIIERSIAGERTKLGGRRSMTYTSHARTVLTWSKKKHVVDTVFRSYADVDGLDRMVQLGERTTKYKLEDGDWTLDLDDDDDDEGDEPVRVESGSPNDFQDLPVFFESPQEFDFELLERFVQTDHVIFKVAFHPKSEFKPLPSGILYIDTDRYRVIQEEFDFGQNPFPLIVRDLERVSRQWTELPGGEWVYTKIRGEISLRADPFGWIPERVTFAYERSDFEFDVDYDERLFGER